jgi:hypothetical protein
MIYIKIVLIVFVIALGPIGYYFQIQATCYLKKDKFSSLFSYGWIFHPEYLEEPGQKYRKKLLSCLLAGALAIAGIAWIDRFA